MLYLFDDKTICQVVGFRTGETRWIKRYNSDFTGGWDYTSRLLPVPKTLEFLCKIYEE